MTHLATGLYSWILIAVMGYFAYESFRTTCFREINHLEKNQIVFECLSFFSVAYALWAIQYNVGFVILFVVLAAVCWLIFRRIEIDEIGRSLISLFLIVTLIYTVLIQLGIMKF